MWTTSNRSKCALTFFYLWFKFFQCMLIHLNMPNKSSSISTVSTNIIIDTHPQISFRWWTHNLWAEFSSSFLHISTFLWFSNYYLLFITKHHFTPLTTNSPICSLIATLTEAFLLTSQVAIFFSATFSLYPSF